MLSSLRKFNANEAAQERLKILEFYDQHGEAETQKYFQVNRKTINVWKQKLERSGHRLESLIPQSTRPKQVRRMTTAYRRLPHQSTGTTAPSGERENQAPLR